MNTLSDIKAEYKQHYDRFCKLEALRDQIDYASLGEDKQMRGEYLHLRSKVIEEMLAEQAQMDDLLKQATVKV